MKALILAAGLGTRLRPYTEKIPKCLFPIAGRPNIDIILSNLIEAGCDDIMINTHHLNHVIDEFLLKQHYPVPVQTVHEPKLLGTGGSIKNLSDFWDESPFFIINGDVVCDVNLTGMYHFHQNHGCPVSICLVNHPEFNIVRVDSQNFITGFTRPDGPEWPNGITCKTFSGIQIADMKLLDFIPENEFFSSITAYQNMIAAGHKVKAYQPDPVYWTDIGSPDHYQEAVFDKIAPCAFKTAFPEYESAPIEKVKIKGDGSDRTWFRLRSADHTLILANHGIDPLAGRSEAASFVYIGNHLYAKDLPVPKIYWSDSFSGLVFVEDLGDADLETFAGSAQDRDRLKSLYRAIIQDLVKLSTAGKDGFDLSWTYQTPYYDVPMILEKECRYFLDEFLNGYLKLAVAFNTLEGEFTNLAQKAAQIEVFGFMHRDFQHRNIMIKNGSPHFIDFQGGRIGPITYDLASLIIDPYIEIPKDWGPTLVRYCYEEYKKYVAVDEAVFMSGFYACCLTRNLQILGAYSFLSRKKNKPQFEKYIPTAVATLKHNLSNYKELDLPGLLDIVGSIRL